MSVVETAVMPPDAVKALDVVVDHGPFMLTKTGVVISDDRKAGDITFDEWSNATEWVQRVNSSVAFWLGDLLEFGERRFGDKYTAAIEATGLAEQTLTNAAYVARHVPIQRRRQDVPFSHHAEVASLPPEQQEKWLEKCSTHGLTRDQLRSGIQAERTAATGKKPVYLVVVTCDDADDQNTVYNEMLMSGRQARMAQGLDS